MFKKKVSALIVIAMLAGSVFPGVSASSYENPYEAENGESVISGSETADDAAEISLNGVDAEPAAVVDSFEEDDSEDVSETENTFETDISEDVTVTPDGGLTDIEEDIPVSADPEANPDASDGAGMGVLKLSIDHRHPYYLGCYGMSLCSLTVDGVRYPDDEGADFSKKHPVPGVTITEKKISNSSIGEYSIQAPVGSEVGFGFDVRFGQLITGYRYYDNSELTEGEGGFVITPGTHWLKADVVYPYGKPVKDKKGTWYRSYQAEDSESSVTGYFAEVNPSKNELDFRKQLDGREWEEGVGKVKGYFCDDGGVLGLQITQLDEGSCHFDEAASKIPAGYTIQSYMQMDLYDCDCLSDGYNDGDIDGEPWGLGWIYDPIYHIDNPARVTLFLSNGFPGNDFKVIREDVQKTVDQEGEASYTYKHTVIDKKNCEMIYDKETGRRGIRFMTDRFYTKVKYPDGRPDGYEEGYEYAVNSNFAIASATKDIKATGITVSPSKYTFFTDDEEKTVQLKASVQPINAAVRSVTWTSSDEEVAKVNEDGEVTAVGPGTAVITAAAADGSGKSASFMISVVDPEAGLFVQFKDNTDSFTYTGSAITPEVLVYRNGDLLSEGTDYSIKYSGNVNVKRDKKGNVKSGAKVTVKGIGNHGGSAELPFMILPKTLGNEDTYDESIRVGLINIETNSKAKPYLTYGTHKLTSKDYKQAYPNLKYTSDGNIRVTGKGNFTGSILIPVKVHDKAEVKNIKVQSDKKAIVYDPLRSEDDMKDELMSHLTVYDAADSKKTPLAENYDYLAYFPEDLLSVGTKKVTILGDNEYGGSATVELQVKPLAVKASAANGQILTNAEDHVKVLTYSYKPEGATVSGHLAVKYLPQEADPENAIPLTEGKDYKLSYKKNKAAGKASYEITFIGNYKGTPALKNAKAKKGKKADDIYSFTIDPFKIADDTGYPAEGIEISLPDAAYDNKSGTCYSSPVVFLNGKELSSGDYTVSYHKSSTREDADLITKNNKLTIPADETMADVYVTIKGKGKFSGSITKNTENDELSYKVYRTSNTVYDMSKAKVTIYAKGYDPKNKKNKVLKSVAYKGSARMISDADIGGTVVVEHKMGGNKYVTLTEGVDYELVYLNNTNKGKAILLVRGLNTENTDENGKVRAFVGYKKAGFSIGAWDLKKILKRIYRSAG